MGEYADVKLNRLRNFLKWLVKKSLDIEIRDGRHNYIIKYTYGDRPYPVPLNHGVVDKHIIKKLVVKLTEEWKVCTKEEFDERIK